MPGRVDLLDGGTRPEVDALVPIPVAVMNGELAQRLRTGQVVLGQRGTLVGQVIFGAEEYDVTVEVLFSQGLRGLGAGEPATDDGDGWHGASLAVAVHVLWSARGPLYACAMPGDRGSAGHKLGL